MCDKNEYVEKLRNKQKAFRSGKNVILTIPNPNTNETNKRFIRINANH